jgi:hypothetical protein
MRACKHSKAAMETALATKIDKKMYRLRTRSACSRGTCSCSGRVHADIALSAA